MFKFLLKLGLACMAGWLLCLLGEALVSRFVVYGYTETPALISRFWQVDTARNLAQYQEHFKQLYWLGLGRSLAALLWLGLGVGLFVSKARQQLTRPRVQFALILLAFLISVIVRMPFMSRPFADRFEWDTASVLTVMEVWDAVGLKEAGFSLRLTYPGAANHFISNDARNFDAEGIGYFTSSPPFSVLFPYLLIKACGLSVSRSSLLLINLLFHFVCSLVIWRLARKVAAAPRQDAAPLAALWAPLLFIFMAPNLWYFSTCYGWPRGWFYMWIPFLLCAVRVFQAEVGSSCFRRRYGLAWACLVLVAYSDWYGVLCGFFFWLALCFQLRKPTACLRYGVLTFAALLLPLSLMWMQYSAVSDFGWNGLSHRLEVRAGLSDAEETASLWRNFFVHYDLYYRALLPFLLAAVAAVLLRMRPLGKRSLQWMVLMWGPLVLHHVLLINYVLTHNYGVWPALPGLLMATTVAVAAWPPDRNRLPAAGLYVLLGLALAYNISHYQSSRWVNRANHSEYQDAGAIISAHADPHEVVFIVAPNTVAVPQTAYYAKRNVQHIPGKQEAEAWLREHHRRTGRVFYFDESRHFIRHEPLLLQPRMNPED